MDYKEAINYINNISWAGCEPGLSRIRDLLDRLGRPQDELRFIHIAGTNGKGSTAAMLASVLRQSGYTTGLFTSPHLIKYNERLQVNGSPIGDEEFAELAGILKPHTDAMDKPPTEFEILTAMGFLYFKRMKCDMVVLEVGMGGEYDSTNVISTPEAVVITAIGFDHMAQLGDTLEQIAWAKAGIIKENSDVIAYGGENEVEAVIENKCRETGSRLHKVDFDRLELIDANLERQLFRYQYPGMADSDSLTDSREAEGYELCIRLLGSYQLKNAAVVLTVVDVLRKKGYTIPYDALRAGLYGAEWNSRFEVMGTAPVFIIDGAHNAHGIRAVTESLINQFHEQKIIFLIGMLSDKNIDEMLDILVPVAKEFITITPDSSRALKSDELAGLIMKKGRHAISCASVKEGVDTAVERAGEDGIVCSLGSLYLAGEVRSHVISLAKLHR